MLTRPFSIAHRLVLRLTLALIWLLAFTLHTLYAQYISCYTKTEGKKWGVYSWEYVTGGGKDIYKWVHKPRFDYVRTDSSSCFGSRECKGFYTYKDSKMGYAWCDGTVLESEFDTICYYTAKKNGKWGSLDKNETILAYEYDSLVYFPFAKSYWDNATRKAFGALKNGVWQLVVVRQPYEQPAVIEPAFTETYEAVAGFEYGAALKRNGKWCFGNFKQMGKPVYSAMFDQIMFTGDHYVVFQNGLWYPFSNDNLKPATEKGWEKVEKTNSFRFLLVWENGQAGILKYEKGKYNLIISPRATAAKIHGDYSNGYTLELTENGQKVTYTETGQVISKTGDLNVSYSSTKGPFRLDLNKERKYVVYDSATNAVLIPVNDYWFEHKNDPQLGHVLWVKTETYSGSRNYRYGLYHYASKTFIKPEYEKEFQKLNEHYLYVVQSNGDYLLWTMPDFKPLSPPFRVTGHKNKYQTLLRDYSGNWHRLDETFTIMPAAQVIDTRKVMLGGMEVEVYDDRSQKLLSLNGKPVNKYIQRERWIATPDVCAITIDGVEKEYFTNGNRAEECYYRLGATVRVVKHIMANTRWPGEAFATPVLLVDSAGSLMVVNAYNNKRTLISSSFSGNQVRFESMAYTLDGISSAIGVVFYRSEEVECTACTNGYNTKTKTRTIKGEVTYETVERTSYTKSTESKWNPNTNSYQYVTTTRPSTSYETIEHREPDREVEETVQVKCTVCNGKGTKTKVHKIIWDGKVLKPYTF